MNQFVAGEERMTAAAAVEMSKEPIFCPKPRRLGEPTNCLKPLIWHSSPNQEMLDAKAGNELLDIILSKGSYSADQSSSPPFFCGSPPSRVSNPIVQDSLFGEVKCTSPTSACKAGVCVRASFGSNPAVRVEGFDCLDRDRGNRSISTLA